MKTPEQLKGAVKNIAKEKKISPQAVLQTIMFERIIDRLAVSEYKDSFILKGGLLISSMVGLAERTTMDMDATVVGMDMTEQQVLEAVKAIAAIDVGDGIEFEVTGISPIREDDEYANFRVHLVANYGKMNIPMKIDITTGDVITPGKIRYNFPLTFEDKTVLIWVYPVETIMAEKYETIIRRSIGNTRARDFYDLYILYKLYGDKIDKAQLRLAIDNIAKKRGSETAIFDSMNILKDIIDSDAMNSLWNDYQKKNAYASGIAFSDIIDICRILQ